MTVSLGSALIKDGGAAMVRGGAGSPASRSCELPDRRQLLIDLKISTGQRDAAGLAAHTQGPSQ
jgi:hypothetical protein